MIAIRPALLTALALAAGATAAEAPCPCHAGKPAAAPARAAVTRTAHAYAPPDVTLIDQDGRPVAVAEALAQGGPLVVNFIFTTCTTICPVMSASFAGLQRQLGAAGEGLRMVSITIDPAHDRPAELEAYARRHGAGPGWTFLTGREEDVRAVASAFDAWVADKAEHRAFTLLRPAGSATWVRVEGLAGAAALAEALQPLQAGR
ncbi:MAG: SCO family protein [Anaeromyxobacter sp.]